MIKVTCTCGATAMVKEEYAGRSGTCRSCGKPIQVPAAAGGAPPLHPRPAAQVPPPAAIRANPAPASAPPVRPEIPADPIFDRDTFLLRQKHLAINEKYTVWDEQGKPLLFIERPAHIFKNLLALAGGLVAGGAIFSLLGFTYQVIPQSIQAGYILFGAMFATLVIILVYVQLEQKRHVEFFRDESKIAKVLTVRQDKKFELFTATYTVMDATGGVLGTFRKNHLYDLLRKQWECRDRLGNLLFLAREDSIIKSLLRKLFGPLFGLLRLNFIFCDPRSGDVTGVFNRSFTILDRYVLDMGSDARKRIDRRLALAMGVMLDTGERR